MKAITALFVLAVGIVGCGSAREGAESAQAGLEAGTWQSIGFSCRCDSNACLGLHDLQGAVDTRAPGELVLGSADDFVAAGSRVTSSARTATFASFPEGPLFRGSAEVDHELLAEGPEFDETDSFLFDRPFGFLTLQLPAGTVDYTCEGTWRLTQSR